MAIWNDAPQGGGDLFDGFWISAPITGPSLSGLIPWYIGFVLFNYEPDPNNALASEALPTSLTLGNFNSNTGGTLGFGDTEYAGNFSFVIDTVTARAVVPEPNTLMLLGLGLAGLGLTRRHKAN